MVNVIKLHISVLRTFSPYFRKEENRLWDLCKIKYRNTKKISVKWKYEENIRKMEIRSLHIGAVWPYFTKQIWPESDVFNSKIVFNYGQNSIKNILRFL